MMPHTALSPDTSTILAHLRHITRRWDEIGEDARLEIVHLSSEDKATVKQVSHYKATPDGLELAASDCAAMNRHKVNTYVVVNPVSAANMPATMKRASAENILGSFFHWADADDAQAAENIRNFVGPKCTFYVLTGTQPCTRPHVYWELEDFTRNEAAWTQTQRAIAVTLKTDPSVVDFPRIMRVAGTINWPKPQKAAKGYVAELTTITIYDEGTRPLISSERMARAFGGNTAPPSNPDSFHIDTGAPKTKTAEEYADILRRARTDGEKHGGVRDLAASLAGSGVSRAMAEAIIRQACPIFDENVVSLIDSAFAKFAPDAPPAQIEATPQTISDFKIDSSEDFLADLAPLEYLVDGILPTGVVYSLTGFAGHGKTTLALQFAISIARGEAFHDRETSKGAVLIMAGENPYNVKWQYAAAIAARGLKARELDIHWIQGRFSVAQWSEVVRAKMQQIPNLKLIIVDSLQAFFEGDNDNDNSQMVAMAHKMRELAEIESRPAMLVIAHPAGKTPAKDNLVPRGGGAFLNEIDGNLTVWSQDASQQTLHHSQKFRGAGFDPLEWVMHIHEFPHLADIHGTPLKLPVSRPELSIERANREVTMNDLLSRYLEAVGQGKAPSEREAAGQWAVSRRKVKAVIQTANDEKLIKRHARTYILTQGGKDYLEAQDAG